MTTSTKIVTSFLLLSLAFVQIMGRPQSPFDSQEIDSGAPPADSRSNEIRKFYSSMNDVPNFYDDELMNRLQYQLLNAYARNLQQNSVAVQNQRLPNIDGGKGMTEQKRHPRYRQCYFNPISCFRK